MLGTECLSHSDILTDALCSTLRLVRNLPLAENGKTTSDISSTMNPLHKTVLALLCGFQSAQEAQSTVASVEGVLRKSFAELYRHMRGRKTRRPEQMMAACGFLLLSTSLMMQSPSDVTITALVGVAMCYMYGDAVLDDPEFSLDHRFKVGEWGTHFLSGSVTDIPTDISEQMMMYCSGMVDGLDLIKQGYDPGTRPALYEAISRVWEHQLAGLRVQSGLLQASPEELQTIGHMKGGYSVIVAAEICLNVAGDEGIKSEDYALLMSMGDLIQLVDDIIDMEDDDQHHIHTQVTEHFHRVGNLDTVFQRVESMCRSVGDAWFKTAVERGWKFVLPHRVMSTLLTQAYTVLPIVFHKYASPELHEKYCAARRGMGCHFDTPHVLEQLHLTYHHLRKDAMNRLQL